MKTQQLLNYARDRWVPGEASSLAEIASAIDGTPVATTGSGGLDFGGYGLAAMALSDAREAMDKPAIWDEIDVTVARGSSVAAGARPIRQRSMAARCRARPGRCSIRSPRSASASIFLPARSCA